MFFTFLLPFLYLVLSFKIPVINSETKLFFKQRAVKKKKKTNSKEIWIYLFVKSGKKLQVGPGFLKLSNFQNVPHTYQSFFGISGSFRITYGIYAQVWRLVGRTWFNLQSDIVSFFKTFECFLSCICDFMCLFFVWLVKKKKKKP